MGKTIILGGGIAGLSLASFINHETIVLEKESICGGLSRSYKLDGIYHDIGPHIIFSKNQEVLDLHTKLIHTNRLRRSNKVFHKNCYIKYPFENDLGGLPAEDCSYCLQEFLNNPYENYQATNMLQFFLKTFGEGITRLYLQPYNQKIWKFDSSCMDTQMVERIPKPSKEDVIASANGTETEGYLHQLYFHYPSEGGFQSMVNAYLEKAKKNGQVHTNIEIQSIEGSNNAWKINTSQGTFEGDRLINCMPIHELFKYITPPEKIIKTLGNLKYNSIYVVVLHLKQDNLGDNIGLYYADPNIIFHRLARLNFFGKNYCHPDNSSTVMAEVTFRPNSYLSSLDKTTVESHIINDMIKIGVINSKNDIINIKTREFKYAYVIYDLDHRQNTDLILNYLKSLSIYSVGRFAEFEYLNTDGVVERTLKLAKIINEEKTDVA